MRWFERWILRSLAGSGARHVAFIMDGNRRFARRQGADTLEGHKSGFGKLSEALEWCLEAGVCTVTVFAFSIENFRRTAEEVSQLFSLAEQKFEQCCQKDDLVERYGVSIRMLGKISLLPKSLQDVMARAVEYSSTQQRCILNVCFAYTSEEEIEQATLQIDDGILRGDLLPCDITEDLINRCLYTWDCEDPDIIIRTSGETRLSDFLLWQSGYSHLVFLPELWPNLSIWSFSRTLFEYRLKLPSLKRARKQCNQHKDSLQRSFDVEWLRKNGHVDPSDSALLALQRDRRMRTTRFLEQLHALPSLNTANIKAQ